MSRARFSIAYAGPSLDDGVMDVRELAPALLAAGQLFNAANTALNGDRAEVRVNAVATGEGSFEVVLDLSQTTIQHFVDLFSSREVVAAGVLIGLLVGSYEVGKGIIWLTKRLKGRQPDEVTNVATDSVRLTIGGESVELSRTVWELFRDFPVRVSLRDLVEKPLRRPGVSSFRARSGEYEEVVTEDQAPYFGQAILPEEVVSEESLTSAFTIVSLTFKEGNKWRLDDGNGPISVLILDSDFLSRVDANQIAFSKGDLLICDVVRKQTRVVDGLKTEYVVERVVKHTPGYRQMSMDFDGRDSEP